MKRYLALLFLLASPAHSQTIDSLGSAGALTGTENVPIFQTANPAVKTTTGAVGNAGALTGDVTKSAGSGVTTLAAGSASNLNSGTLNAARMPALTGDCTTSAGTVATTCPGPHPGYVSTNYYVPVGYTTFATTTAATANRIMCYYAYVPQVITISTVGLGVVTAGSTNSQIGLYKSANGKPGSKIDNTGNIANTGAGSFVTGTLGGSQQIGPGTANGQNVWWCTNQNDSTVTYRGLQLTTSMFGSMYNGATALSAALNSGGVTVGGFSCTGANCNGGSSTFNTWPATLAGSTWTEVTTNTIPFVAFQVLSVP